MRNSASIRGFPQFVKMWGAIRFFIGYRQPPYTGDHFKKEGFVPSAALSEKRMASRGLDPCSLRPALSALTLLDELTDCSRAVRREGRSVCHSVVLLRTQTFMAQWELRDQGYRASLPKLCPSIVSTRPNTHPLRAEWRCRDRRRNGHLQPVHWISSSHVVVI